MLEVIGGAEVVGAVAVFFTAGLAEGLTQALMIEHCPFCGATLPPSLRDEWFEKVWAMGLEPDDPRVPARYGARVRLILIRHALPERVEIVSDAPDPALSETGLRQAGALVAALAGEQIDAVWSSPLLRARQTAEPLAVPRSLTVREHPGLAEFDFGNGVYIPAEDVQHPAVAEMKKRIDNQSGYQAVIDFQRTVVAAVQDVVAATARDSTAAVVCHGGVVNAYASSVIGARDVLFAKTHYTGFSQFTVSRTGRARLVSLNEHQHLRVTASRRP
ncbi:MAG: histidine phosphatase family protein [Jatrophihabitans sp.]